MAPRNRPHVIIGRPANTDPYTSHMTGRGSPRPAPPIDRFELGTRLAVSTRNAAEVGREQRRQTAHDMDIVPSSEGVYLTFDSSPDFELHLMGFDSQRRGEQPELVAVQQIRDGDETTERATVFVPDGKIGYFISRFEQYASETTATGAPRNANFVERIRAVRLATIRSLWTEGEESFPSPDELVWWEVWLRHRDGEELDRLDELSEPLGIAVGPRHLVFDNRTVVLVRATASQLASAMDLLDDLAELRSVDTTAEYFAGATVNEQQGWTEDLLSRLRAAVAGCPSICVMDTGVNRQHPLLVNSLLGSDLHTCEPAWGTYDHDGHGTQMAGLGLFGDLQAALESSQPVRLRHCLESVKILPPPPDANDPDLYGSVTGEAVNRVEIQAPDRRRCFSMAVTAEDSSGNRVPGTPTSWSAAVDALAAGRAYNPATEELEELDADSVGNQRLFVVSTGNIREFNPNEDALDRNDLEIVEDPAQAWNALCVGAYTELVDVEASGPDFEGWTPVAESGDLSPFSRTSVALPRQWPIKPEVVLEGGNVARSPDGNDIDWPDSLQVLTTNWGPTARPFTTSNATSAATAQASCLAATISSEYPGLWPETIRALIVHSAEWTPVMTRRVNEVGDSRTAREDLIRRYGFGVPSEERALKSASDALTLVVQDSIHPYDNGLLREMHTHDLPWPTEALEELADAPVRLRVTLSYFIEPNPARRGWKRRYRYASHGLRFHLKRPDETNDNFLKRLNKRALEENESKPTAGEDNQWHLGSQARSRGSLHADFWDGTAADLASRGRLAIVPVTGWWKENRTRDRSHLGARYGLVLSISTPVQTTDLWTPVANQVGLPITFRP